MKKPLFFIVLFVASFAFAKAGVTPTTSETTPPSTKETTLFKVTVYLSGAQIQRNSQITITEGTNTFIFDNLSNDIDENSIQISGLGDSSILSINFGINYLTKQLNSAKVDSLKTLKKQLETTILKLNSTISGLTKEEEVISLNQRLGSTVTEIDLVKIKELSAYYRTRVTEIKNALLDAEIEKTALQREVSDITKQFNELNVTEEKSKGQITLKLNSERTESLKLRITYNVSEAGWYPEYDLKAIASDAPLELSYKAHLYQKTGISWDDVNLVLSTGDPNTNNLKPSLDTKYLNFVNQYYRNNNAPTKDYNHNTRKEKKVLGYTNAEKHIAEILAGRAPGIQVSNASGASGASSNVVIRGYSSIEGSNQALYVVDGVPFTSENGNDYISNNNNSSRFLDLDEDNIKNVKVLKGLAATTLYGTAGRNGVIVITTKKGSKNSSPTATGDTKTEGLTNTTFEIKKKYSIDSDGDVTVIEIDKFQVPATYEYFVAPSINENVFLTASIKDWVRYSLLPGEANIYFEGSFSGKTFINPLETTEELSVSLGVDPNIVVKRKQLDNFKSKSFIGTQRIIDMAYATTIKNNKTKAIKLNMVDRIPISQNKEIKVDEMETGDAIFDKDTGLLEWSITLAPTATTKKEFSYELKYPKNKRINL